MTGDGVNDAPALAQAEVGVAVKNATDIAKDSASAVLTDEGLGGIIRMIKTSRSIYQRVYSWTLQMVTRKLHIAFFIVVMLFLTNSLMLSLTSTLLMLFLADFATMSMSTDNVRSSQKPDKFSMRSLFGTGISLGILMTIESALFAVPALSYFGIIGSMEKIYTFGFAYLNFAGIFTILILRERDYFWKSKPSTLLSVTV
jgi:H+-transporting ATPase